LEEAIKKIFPEADRQLCVPYAVRAALNKARKKDREALAEDLKRICRAETQEETEEALRNLRERWGTVYPQDRGALGNQSLCPSCVFMPPQAHPKVSHTTNFLERLAKEVKRRTKVVEVFCGEGAMENLLYLILSQRGEV
jgi:transposase-like protein